jgi:hypothetical protein
VSAWEPAFVAMSVAVGEDADVARGSLDDSVAARVASLTLALKAESRVTRAQALARELGPILGAVEKVGIAWP